MSLRCRTPGRRPGAFSDDILAVQVAGDALAGVLFLAAATAGVATAVPGVAGAVATAEAVGVRSAIAPGVEELPAGAEEEGAFRGPVAASDRHRAARTDSVMVGIGVAHGRAARGTTANGKDFTRSRLGVGEVTRRGESAVGRHRGVGEVARRGELRGLSRGQSGGGNESGERGKITTHR
jgi:hypothetical protein